MTSTDHKPIAIRIGLSAAVFFVLGGLLALVLRTELAEPGLQVVSHSGYSELFTMHGSTMVFLVVIPIAVAACAYIVPLQVGAKNLAGPRWALAASWLFPVSGVLMWAGWLTREGAGRAGWYSYDPLSDQPNTPGPGMDLWIIAVMLATLAAIIIAWCVLITLLRRRTPGMTLLRIPPFSWTALATCLLVVFSFPSLIVGFTFLLLDRHGADILSPISYQNLFWFYGHPAVYVMFFPFVGMVAEAASVLSGRRFFGYHIFIIGLLGFTALAMSAWGHHMLTTGGIPNKLFSLTSTALIVPAGIEYFDILGTLWLGSVRVKTPMLFVAGFLIQFLVGGITGIWTASPALDYHVADSYFIVAHFHYTLFAGSLFGFFAGLYLWWPKLTGRFLPEGLGKVHFVTLLIGTSLTFIPQFFLGYEGMARRLADYPASTGWQPLNLISTVGAFLIAVSTLAFAVAVGVSFWRKPTLGPNPWERGGSLEWVAASPPGPGNFDGIELPPIHSYAPLLDQEGAGPDTAPGHEPETAQA